MNNFKPKISVIIPVYNTEKYLSETLNSVMGQSITDIEIVCVDDGSTDNSLQILEQYQKNDSRIKIIKQSNQGVVTARNTGISQSKGDLIYLLDSDDLIDKHLLEKSYRAIIEKRGDIITTRVYLFGEANREMILPTPNKLNMSLDNCLPNAALFSRTLFEKSGGFDTAFDKGLEDYDFWLNMIYRQKAHIYRIPEILFFYRIKPADESINQHQKKFFMRELKMKLSQKYPEMKRYRLLAKFCKMFFSANTKHSS